MAEKSKEEKIETAWKILEYTRGFNHHFDFKCGTLLTVAGAVIALLGALLKENVALLVKPPVCWPIILLSLATMVGSFATFIHILVATRPSLTSEDKDAGITRQTQRDEKATSLIYFDDIARSYPKTVEGKDGYMAALKAQLDDEGAMLTDLGDQIVEVAKITSEKALRIQKASNWLLFSLLTGGPAFAVILIAKASNP